MDSITYYIGSAAIIIGLASTYLPMLVGTWLEIAEKIHQHKEEKKR